MLRTLIITILFAVVGNGGKRNFWTKRRKQREAAARRLRHQQRETELDDMMRSIEVPRDGSSTVNNPLKAAVSYGINDAEHQPLLCTFVPDSADVKGNIAQWLTFQEARELALTNRQNHLAMAARVSPEGFVMEMYEEVITALGLPVEQFMREFPFVPKVIPPIPGIIALRRTKDFLNGESHVCIKLQSCKGTAFIVTLKQGKIDGCKMGIIRPRNEEREKDFEHCTASFGYPHGLLPTIDSCVRFLRESYMGHQKEISAAAFFNAFTQRLYRPSTPSLD